MEEVALTDGANFTIAEESAEAKGAEPLLDEARVMAWGTEHPFSAPIAATQATTVNHRLAEALTRAAKQFFQILAGGSG